MFFFYNIVESLVYFASICYDSLIGKTYGGSCDFLMASSNDYGTSIVFGSSCGISFKIWQ
jgi:hypothetical protein